MAKPISFGELDIKIVASMDESQGIPDPEVPFRILILGDFSGWESREIFEGSAALADRRVFEVDRDNLNDVMGRIKPEIRLPFAGSESDALTIRFSELDDLHPDRIYEQHEIFEPIREIRRKLDNPRTFEEAASQVKSWTELDSSADRKSEKVPPTAAPDPGEKESAGLLDRILEDAGTRPSEIQPASAASDWDRFLKEIVQPHLVADKDPRQMELEDTINSAASGMMRIILHHPNYQALESAWKGMEFLVSRLETDVQLKLFLLDLSKSELAADLNGADDLRRTGLYNVLVEQTVGTAGGEPWAAIGGNYTFSRSREDAELLGRIAKIAAAAGAPFIAAAAGNLLGCDSLAEHPDPDDWRTTMGEDERAAWQALHKLPEAGYLGLGLPRFLLRLPYGADTEPLEKFEFEEMAEQPQHEDYLWGNPCFACACLLGRYFSADGWNLQIGAGGDIDNLPLHIQREADETGIKPCAEVLLTGRAAEIIMNAGFMPLLSFREQDRIRVARFQSLAQPPTRLAGRWG